MIGVYIAIVLIIFLIFMIIQIRTFETAGDYNKHSTRFKYRILEIARNNKNVEYRICRKHPLCISYAKIDSHYNDIKAASAGVRYYKRKDKEYYEMKLQEKENSKVKYRWVKDEEIMLEEL